MYNPSQKTDSEIQQDVLNELKWDPSVTASEVSVTANDGIVTLRGSVPHYFEKSSAENAAQRVSGVRAVADEIEVNMMGSYERSDEQIAEAALSALKWSYSVPKDIKVIVVTRNPLDACVSCYFHAWNPAKSGWPFSAWAAAWFNGFVPHGSWFDWVRDWANYSRGPNGNQIHWVQFEDLKANPEDTVQKLANFLGVGDDKELVQSAIEDSSFESMKEKATSQGEKECAHLRKGVSGDWRNYFSDELAQEFVEKYNTILSGTGIKYSLGAGESDIIAP